MRGRQESVSTLQHTLLLETIGSPGAHSPEAGTAQGDRCTAQVEQQQPQDGGPADGWGHLFTE